MRVPEWMGRLFKREAQKAQEQRAVAPLMRSHVATLPDWARVREENTRGVRAVVEVDTDRAFKEWLEILKPEAVDQFWLEVVYQCVKLDVQASIQGTPLDPRVARKAVMIKMRRAPAYALAKFPPGRGVAAASKGREARGHYQRVRGFLPL